MRRITQSVLALFLVGASSCVAYQDPGYQSPPGTPPDYRGQPDYRQPQPPPPDYRAPDDYRDDRYPDPSYDSRYGYDDYYRSPSYEVGFFYNELSPYGEWVFTYDYGWAWYPRNVRAGWRPYYYGRWVPSDYGWMWVSFEPFGWATYHYGRWAYDYRLGWVWIPGRTWGPAWVSWQYGQGYIGWAPLPPEVGFQIGIGLRFGDFSIGVGISPSAYTFVGDRYFMEAEPYRYAVPTVRNTTIIRNTTNITNYTYVDNRVINKGVDFVQVERATGKRVRPLRVQESTSAREAKVSGDQVVVYKAPREKVETVKIDDSQPIKKGYGRERAARREPPGQERRADRERQQTPPPARTPEAERQSRERREPRVEEQRPERTTPPTDLEVAPRYRAESRARNESEMKRQQEKEQQDLKAFQREEKQRLEKSQREEKEKARGPQQRDIEQRHAQEAQALQEQQKQQEQQLQAKQENERRAVKSNPPGKQKAEEKKGQDKSKKKPQAEEPPPPHR